MATLRDIKQRISSTRSTQQITRTMEMATDLLACGLDPDRWLDGVRGFGALRGAFVGHPSLLRRHARDVGRREVQGIAGAESHLDAVIHGDEPVRGGELDLEKAAMTLLQDYRTGTLGRISLETPTSRAEMLRNATPRQDTEQDEDQADSV